MLRRVSLALEAYTDLPNKNGLQTILFFFFFFSKLG